MKKLLYIILCVPILMFSACNVHEWPEMPKSVKLHLRLNYETEMTKWEHAYDGNSVIDNGLGAKYNNILKYGNIRYIIRIYPISEKQRSTQEHTKEFIFNKSLKAGYNHEVTLDIQPGEYNIMVWSDLVQKSEDEHFYNAYEFREITLIGDHKGNVDYKDAFRGSNQITLSADVMERKPDTLDITMQRPLAKFEFISNDVEKFIDYESTRLAAMSNNGKNESISNIPTKTVNLEDYKVVFYYVGFMPHTYSIFTDKPIDSSTGVMFESSLKKFSDSNASVGFDYVFVNGKESAVTVQIGIFDKEGTQISMTKPIEVPLKRSRHTLLNGMFLTTKASGGVVINPDYDGDHNIIFP